MIVLLALIAAMALMGRMLPRPPGAGTAEWWLYRLLIGAGGVAAIGLAAGAYSLQLALGAIYAIAAASLALELRQAARGAAGDAAGEESGTARAWYDWCAIGALAAALAAAFLHTLAPVTSWDAAVAHLALPSEYAAAGRIAADEGNVYSGYPHLAHALFAMAHAGGGSAAAAMTGWFLSALACGAMYVLGRRLAAAEFGADPARAARTGFTAAALLATAPVFVDQAGALGIDVPFTGFTIAAMAALGGWRRHGGWQWLAVAGALAGLSCGIRHTGYLTCLLLAIGALALTRERRLAAGAVFLGVAAIAAAPWLARSWIVTGNPVFPLLLGLFPGTVIPHQAITGFGLHESAAAGAWRELARFPWDIVMRPQDFDGWSKSPGVMALALGVPGLLLCGWGARLIGLYSVTGGVFFFFFQRLARYLLPFFTPMLAVAALVPARLGRLERPVLALLAGAFLYGIALHAAALHFKLPVVFGRETREAYLERRVERYPMFAFANQHLDGGGRVLSLDQRAYYLRPRGYFNHWGLFALRELDPEAQADWLLARDIRHVLLPVDHVMESGMLRAELQPTLWGWRQHPRFSRIHTLRIPRVRGSGFELVEIYEVRPRAAPGE